MLSLPNITERKWAIMDAVEQISPAATTIKTLLRRLISKQAAAFKVGASNTRLYYYYPLVARQDCTIKLWEPSRKIYLKNNFESFLATLLDQEILRPRSLLQQKNTIP